MRLSDCTTQLKQVIPAPSRRFGKVCGALAFAALLAAGLSGCGSIKPVKYYQLTHPPTTPLADGKGSTTASLGRLTAAYLTYTWSVSRAWRHGTPSSTGS